jgi:hypothetical protein
MYCIKFNENKDFFYVEINDKINHVQIIQFLDIISNAQQNEKNLLFITDYRNAMIDEKSTDPIEKIALFINTNMKSKFNHITWANISNSHLPTTGAILLYELIKGSNIVYEPFATIEKALSWMNLSFDDFNNLVPISANK